MSVKKPTYEEMEARLAEAEAARRSVYKKRNNHLSNLAFSKKDLTISLTGVQS